MLRTIFVISLIIIGLVASFYSSFNALLFYLWIAYFRPESWVWGSYSVLYNLSFFTAIFLLLSTLLTGVKLRFNFFTSMLSLILLHSFLSALMSDYSSVSFSYWIDFFKVIVISYLITILINSEIHLRIALVVISLSLGLEGAKQGLAHIILNPGAVNTNTHPFLGDNNGTAVGMLMLAPVLFALFQTTKQKLFKYGFLFLTIGVVYRALSTYSRGGFLVFLIMCVIFWLRSKHKIRAILIVVFLTALLLPTFPQSFWDRMDSITATSDERDASAASRIYYWELGIEMAKHHPVFGVGHRAYSEAYNNFDHTQGRFGSKREVHSSWFGILSEWGFPGIILFLMIYFYSIYSCIQSRNNCKNNPELRILETYCTSIETSLIAGIGGITFLSYQYSEILWHYFALAVVCKQIVQLHNNSEKEQLQNHRNIIEKYL